MGDVLDADVAAIQRIGAVKTILDVVCRITNMRFAAVARVTDTTWIACSVLDKIPLGAEVGVGFPVEIMICNEIRKSGQPVIIENIAEHPVYCDHRTAAELHLQSSISFPIFRQDGTVFGTLCAFDPEPRRVNTPEIIGMFKLFADLIAFHLDANDQLAETQAAVVKERAEAKLREHFIAVLGHDLRNPLTAIEADVSVLLRSGLGDDAREIVEGIRGSARRMSRMLRDVSDFTRGRLGSGLTVYPDADEPLTPALQQVVDEFRIVYPERDIDSRFVLPEGIACDRSRVAQLLSNLISNAIRYGSADGVRVWGFVQNGSLELSVSNKGDPIPPEVMSHLFQPFAGGERARRQGLGLGLYIASEIARAHGGTLEVVSTPAETRATFRMPAP